MRQGFVALVPRPHLDEAVLIGLWLTSDQQRAFLALSMHDRAHLVRVALRVVVEAPGNHDLIVAALLHDLGKQCGRARVRLIDRAAKVLISAIAPSMLDRMAMPPPTGIRAGLVLAVHHPEIGARQAQALGCSERTCWLIANHERSSRYSDPDLNLLAAIDNATP